MPTPGTEMDMAIRRLGGVRGLPAPDHCLAAIWEGERAVLGMALTCCETWGIVSYRPHCGSWQGVAMALALTGALVGHAACDPAFSPGPGLPSPAPCPQGLGHAHSLPHLVEVRRPLLQAGLCEGCFTPRGGVRAWTLEAGTLGCIRAQRAASGRATPPGPGPSCHQLP